ncbi:transaldolase [Lactobacillus crispatus]|uniref:Transaldolase n=1 Tax=Lactobacillus crispatus TaxID=47770 RepID=A0A4R6CPW9_9LACO|nr:transaldolase [Lactobacillus crispatus]KWU10551.1 transaldolase [Lactobacillus crispatus]MCT7697246.1 transaldolase [Lactobacillus crispatus]MCT7708709.1 transaldolase [Lactobacillus crispatus]MCZ9662239.1 transaldolase [Lactobacillus crispatus]TDN28500.1 transaldolase [Lactobacillus crispatus]
MKLSDLNVQIYADGAVIDDMIKAKDSGVVKGFTTNPSLMKKAGVKDYVSFAKEALAKVTGLPISFEVFGDDFETMEKEAKKISSLGENVFVKIPITNTKGESSVPLIKKLSAEGIKVNVTAVFTIKQVKDVLAVLKPNSTNIVSIFAGRLADTGIDPIPTMTEAAKLCHESGNAMLLWASCREVYNIFEADKCGADIITCTAPVIAKLNLIGISPEERSLQTVQGFNKDVKALGFSIL